MQCVNGPSVLKSVEHLSNFYKMRQRFTPDLRELNLRNYHLVFFPDKIGIPLGGMKQYIQNERVKYLGGAISVGGNYQNRKTTCSKDKDRFLTIAGDDGTFKGHVRGFVSAVPVSMVCQLDMSYNRGYQTERYRRQFWLTAQKTPVAKEAIVYLYKDKWLQDMEAMVKSPQGTVITDDKVSQLKNQFLIL